MPRYLCAGDLHLGAGADLGREPGERLADQEAVLERIVELANELDAVILWAGDAWERRRPTPSELLAFRRPLHRLRYPLVGISGNHDVEAFERPTGYDVFLLPSGSGRAAVYTTPTLVRVADATVAVLPWAPPGRLVALEAGGDRDDVNRRLADGLLEIARGLFAGMPDDRARILLAHWSVGGAVTPTGVPAEVFREPVLPLEALEAIGFDAIVLGHVHKPQTLGPSTFYVGSPMPLNFGEATCDHGVYMLDVEPGSAGVYFMPIESRRLVAYDVRAETTGPAAGVTLPLTYDEAIVKLTIKATEEQARRLDVAAIRRELEEGRDVAGGGRIAAYRVWQIRVDVERERVVRAAGLDETIDDVEAFRLWLEASGVTVSTVDGGSLPELEATLLDRHTTYLREDR